MAVTLASLPPEVLLQIFRHLCHTDLNTVARVSWRLYALGTLPSLWRHFNLKVKFKKKEAHRVLFISQTLKKVTSIYRLSYLAHLDLCDNDLSSLCPKLLARIVNTVEDCDIGYTDLTHDQVSTLFVTMDEETRLRRLNVRGNILKSVPGPLLARLINRLEEVNLWSTSLSRAQVQALLSVMSRQTQLKRLNLGANDLSWVSPEHLAPALAGLVEARLEGSYLTAHQASRLLTEMAKRVKYVEVLDLSQNNLAHVPEQPFSSVIARIREVNLTSSRLGPEQARALLNRIAESSRLESLKLSENDLSSVPANVLAKAVNSIPEVELSKCSLTIYQGLYLFSMMSEETSLKKLTVDGNNLSLVPADQLARGVNRLCEVDLCGTKMTDMQITTIFLDLLTSTCLEKIVLDGNIETRYKDFVSSMKDKVNVIVTFNRSNETTTIHLFQKFQELNENRNMCK